METRGLALLTGGLGGEERREGPGDDGHAGEGQRLEPGARRAHNPEELEFGVVHNWEL